MTITRFHPIRRRLSGLVPLLGGLLVASTTGGTAFAAELVNSAGAAGIAQTAVAYNVSVADYNGDGWPDFLFNRRLLPYPMILYQNLKNGSFSAGPSTIFGKADRPDCEWGDPNADGRPDLYCAVGAKYGTATKSNQLWIQQSNGTFTNQAAAWGVTDPYGRGRQVTFLRANGDAYPDLFVGNHYPRTDSVPSPNRLFLNAGGTGFQEQVVSGLTGEIGARCASAADIDADGYDDLLVCGNNGLRIYRNTAGTGFVNMAPDLGLSDTHLDALAVDVSGDARLDLVLTRLGKTKVYIQTGWWAFGPAAQVASGGALRVATPDNDGDGDVDLYIVRDNLSGTPTLNESDLLLVNKGNGTFTSQIVSASTTVGYGKMGAAIDHDGDGRDAVLVVNSADGKSVPGPLELMALP